jgi:hypothetical protein
MKNIQDVLHEKETEVERLTREIKLLRLAARMLDEEGQNRVVRTAEAMSSETELPAVNVEGRVLDLAPAPAPTNGDLNKRWP